MAAISFDLGSGPAAV